MENFANLAKATLLLAAIGVMGSGMFASPAAANFEIEGGTPVCSAGTNACYDSDNRPRHYWPETF